MFFQVKQERLKIMFVGFHRESGGWRSELQEGSSKHLAFNSVGFLTGKYSSEHCSPILESKFMFVTSFLPVCYPFWGKVNLGVSVVDTFVSYAVH